MPSCRRVSATSICESWSIEINEQTSDRLLLTLAAVVYDLAEKTDDTSRRDKDTLWDAMQDGTDEYVKEYGEEIYKRLY